ncbi:MAG: non-ribosomal peptide synthase/polyketide synthase [Bacteroidota bacterium]
MVKEFTELYAAYSEKREADLEPLPVQFADYATWQRAYLEGGILDKQLAYWKKKLEGVNFLGLPSDFERPLINSTRGALLKCTIDKALTQQLLGFSQAQGATLYMTLLAAFKVLLYRYSGQEDVCVGSGVAGRMRTELESLIGFFVNSLVLRSDLGGNPSFVSLVQQVRNTTLDAYENQDTPFEKVVEAVVGERDVSQNPLFQVVFVLQNVPRAQDSQIGELVVTNEPISHTTSQFDLTWFVEEHAEETEVSIEYCLDIFAEETIQRMFQHYLALLAAVMQDPTRRIGEINLLSQAEKDQLLHTFNLTAFPYPADQSMASLFQAQVALSPDACALSFGNQHLTYRQLDQRANQLAHFLHSQGVTNETMVPLCLERSLDLLVSILAILKAGGAYVPVDATYPLDRVAYMLQDTQAQLIITTSDQQAKLQPAAPHAQWLCLDALSDTLASLPTTPVAVSLTADSLAYVIYTSGSTGRPKGTLVTHGNVTSLVKGGNFVSLTAEDILLSTGSPSFDAATFEYWGMLLNGGQLVLCSEDQLLDSALLKEEIQRRKVTKIWFTSSWFNQLVDDAIDVFHGLSTILVGGEKLSETHLRKFRSAYPQVGVINGYGPTENTTFSLTYPIQSVSTVRSIPIGYPLGNRSAYVLNERQELVPIGVAGELYVGGAGVSRGYLHQPELTAEKFMADPFSSAAGARLYRTGDRARWLADGTVEYLGRMDEQVKIRGHRIEPGEIERTLNNLEAVSASCVVVKQQESEKKLVSYYVPDHSTVKIKEAALSQQQVESWKALYNTAYSKADEVVDLDEEFNITGWNDSFTGGSIPSDLMQQWVDDITELILALKPKRVLEIGSGTGLIYYRLVGHIEKYIGTDFSQVSMSQIERRIAKGERQYPETKLILGAAHELVLDEAEQIDTVVVNSIIQYFPSEEYLTTVLAKGISMLKGQGRLVVGDVRDLRLLPAFKGRLQLAKLQDRTGVKEFEWKVDQEAWKEEELCISPAYFYHLQTLYPEITHVEIQWKQGNYLNELTLYRYTVVLHVGIEKPMLSVQWQSWDGLKNTQDILEQLNRGEERVALQDVPNHRLWSERLLTQGLRDVSVHHLRDLTNYMARPDVATHTVNELLAVAKSKGYYARFLLDEDPFKMNLLLEKTPFNGFVDQHYSHRSNYTDTTRTNIPLFADVCAVLQQEIRHALLERLPEYMVPADFVALQYLPLTGNGKVNRKFLSEWEEIQRKRLVNYQAPVNDVERQLADIWQTLLSVDKVGMHDNFFELGGHSLLATRVVSAVRKALDVELTVKDFFLYPSIAELSIYLQAQTKGSLLPAIEVIERPALIPLSFSQERLWFIDQLEGSLAYHMPVALRLKGALNHDAITLALQAIVNRHEVLRTVIDQEEGQPYQRVLPPNQWQLTIVEAADNDALSAALATYLDTPFDLTKDAMLRAQLIRVSENEHILVMVMHHIASDGWSTGILVQELVELYSAYLENRPAQIEPLAIQFADYALWERTYLDGAVLEQKLAYWQTKLAGVETLNLPTDYPRPAVKSTAGVMTPIHLDKDLANQLQKLAKEQGATLYMTLLAAFKVLLHRYSGQVDICVGSPISGRTQQEMEALIGFFVNTLALRSDLSHNPSFVTLLKQVKHTTLGAYDNQEAPFEKVVEAVVKERDLSRSPLFEVMFILQNLPEVPNMNVGDVQLSAYEMQHSTAQFDLTIALEDSGEGLTGYAEYCVDLFTEETIQRMIGHYTEILRGIVQAPATPIGSLALLPAPEKQWLLAASDENAAGYPTQETIVSLFEAQAARTPEAIALTFETQQLTYQELNEQANQLAHYLRRKGVQADTLVPICLERSLDMIVGLLGILKAGGAYVPIDPAYPQERISFILNDTAARVVVSAESCAAVIDTTGNREIILLDRDREAIQACPTANPAPLAAPNHLAYVIYTSGSTGKPKGVLIEHYNVVRLFETDAPLYDFNGQDVWTMFHSFCFDFSVWEMYGALLYGGRLVIVPKSIAQDASLFGELLVSEGVTVLNQTPSAFYVLQEQLTVSAPTVSVRYVIFGGEALNPMRLKPWKEAYPACRLINMYGITETTVHVTFQEIGLAQLTSASSVIGKTIPTLGLYILDAQLNLSPIGVPGELHVAGAGLARGYLNREELTKERFIQNPFSDTGDSRLYKTGDLARWLPDGNIEYLGRIDDQVKIRGYRIELGEIENALQESAQVKQAVVVALKDPAGTHRLVVYLVPQGSFDREALLEELKNKLPDYMVPSVLVALEKMPLTSNGKVDRKALPDPGAVATNTYVAPRNPIEQTLTDIWQELLKVEQIGIYDNFFDLGGHSLLSMRLVAAVRKRMQVEISIKQLFLHATIEQLAQYIQSQAKGSLVPTLQVGIRPALIPLSFSQERVWFIDQLEGSVPYHMPLALRLKGKLDTAALEKTIQTIINRHEVLRTVIGQEDGRAYQRVMEPDQWTMEVIQDPLYRYDKEARQELIQNLIEIPFDLAQDHMLRLKLIELGAEDHIMVMVMHHIASDGWSIGIFVTELMDLYTAYSTGAASTLAPLALQYIDYALWQRSYLQGEVLETQLGYWKNKLTGVPLLNLPTDFPRQATQSNRGSFTTFHIDKAVVTQLQQLAKQQEATLFMTMLSAFNVLLYRYSGQTDICVGSGVAGRTQQEVEGLIGFFINTLALRSDLSNNPTFTEVVQQVKQTTLGAYEHQEVPFEKIVEAVVKERDPSRSPLFQALFGSQNTPEAIDVEAGELRLSHESIDYNQAKFELSFFIEENEEGILGSVSYCVDLFSAETIDRMTSHFTTLLESIIQMPEARIGSLPMLLPAEKTALLAGFNQGRVALPADKTIVDVFAEQAARTPNAIALVFEEESLTYAELDERSNQLANYLVRKGVKANTLVPLCLERSAHMIVGILGILKAGGAYVPIDADYPAERLAFMLEDTAASVILSSNACENKFADMAAQVIALDGDWDSISLYPTSQPSQKPGSQNLVYVIYTSGSTGNPKGVLLTHHNLMDYLMGLQNAVPLADCQSFGLLSSIATDLGNTVLFGAFLNGGALHVFSKAAVNDAEVLQHYFAINPVDCIKIVPSHWKALSMPDSLLLPTTLLIFGGEALELSVVDRIRATGSSCTVVNHYGPTETTIGKLLHVVRGDISYGAAIPIGKPFSNTRVYVLSLEGQLVPVGVPGVLYIGGEGVAKGYLNNDALTESKFIADPLDPQATTKVYCTGDLVKYLPDGNILFLGRADDQVKIRGYRIELGEIDLALNQCELISQGIVVVRADSNGNKRLVGYVIPAGAFNREGILAALSERLPEYMVPSMLVCLDSFPLMANGKIDKKALPDPDASTMVSEAYVAPRNEIEQTLAEIWQDVLGIEQIGIHDNFFQLGGDSIIIIQIVSRARRSGYQLQVGDLFDYQTIATLYTVLSVRTGISAVTSVDQGTLTGGSGLLPIQQWYFEREAETTSHFNQSFLLALDKRVDTSTLSAAIAQLMHYHDSLRFVYTQGEAGWEQTYGSFEGDLSIVDLRTTTADELAEAIATYGESYQRSLNTAEGILVRAVLMQMPDNDEYNRLLLVVHHLAIDGVSWRIILEDLESLLEGLSTNTPVSLGRKGSSYREWHQTLVRYGQSPRALNQREYWSHIVQQARPVRVDHQYEGLLHLSDMQSRHASLDSGLTQQLLQEVPKAYHTDINDVLLAALAKVLSEWNGGNVVIGLEGHGREDIASDVDISHTVGWFTSLYPVLLAGSGSPEASLLLRDTKEQLRQIPDKGLGYGVLKYINKEAALQGNDPWDITFNYLGQFDTLGGKGKWFSPADEEAGSQMGEDYIIRRKLSVNSMVIGGELILDWSYSTRHFDEASIALLQENYRRELAFLITHAVAQARKASLFTPSDYGLGGLVSNAELDTFLDVRLLTGETRRSQLAGLYRLSGLQSGMLFHGLYDATAGAYINQFTYQLYELNLDAFVQSWQHLLDKHTILRTSFYSDAFRIPVQAVYRDIQLPIIMLDYRGLDKAGQEQAWLAYEEEDRNRGFDFIQAPLMRLALMQVQDREYRLVWTFHHMLLDGWSVPVLMAELLQTYEQAVTGNALVTPEEDRYEDYIRYLERRDKEEETAYWRQYMSGITSGTLLPFINSTAERNKGKGDYQTERLWLDTEKAKAISNYAKQNRLTTNTLMQGIWAYLLYRYTGQTHVTYGAIVSGRPDDLPNVEKRVGIYINTLPFHGVIDPEQGIVEWLWQIQNQQVQSRKYQFTPLNDSQKWAGVSGELFDTLFVFENYPVDEAELSHNWKLLIEELQVEEHTNYPLNIVVSATEEVVVLVFQYNSTLLAKAYIEKMLGHFAQVLDQLISQPAAKVGDISLLTPKETRRLLVEFNATQATYPTEKTVLDLFQERVTATPTSTALIFEGETLSYQDLDTRSNQLAHYLTEQGIPTGALVPICLDRSFEMIVGILGILKIGAAYLPIDPSYPAERLVYLLEDSQAQWLITTSTVEIAGSDALQRIELDTQQEAIQTFPETALPTQVNPSDLAYVIYTSGSTGKPKGVMLEHKGLLNFVLSHAEALRLTPALRTLQFSSFGFDASCYEIFNTLASGGCLVLPHKDDLLSADRFGAMLRSQQVELSLLPPSYLHTMREEVLSLKTIISGGEALNREDALYLQNQGIRVINAYGPTENTVVTTLTDNPIQADRVVIGKPIANVQVYFLDGQSQLCPVGVAGEMVVGGNSLARGYWNREELTAEKFIPNPFSTDPAARLYRTGDLGRWLPDGNIEYLGRIDDQVKVRGYRIELGEIETALQSCAFVNQAVVLARTDERGNKRLIGYVIPNGSFDKHAIINYLKAQLPEYMVPAVWVELESFPLMSNGKIDKKALPDPDTKSSVSNAYVAPRNETEQKLADIWQAVLGIEQVGIQDNFFELGGDSIITIQVVSRAKRFGYELKPKDLFIHQTISGLSALLAKQSGESISGEQGILTGTSGLLPIQQWYFETAGTVSSHFNQSVLLAIDKRVDTAALSVAVAQLLQFHDGLRFAYKLVDGAWEQTYGTYEGEIDLVDLKSTTSEELAEAITAQADIYQRNLNIEKGILVRTVLMQTPMSEEHNRLLIVVHHLAVDGVSWRIILEDLERLLDGLATNTPVSLGLKGSSYREWYNALARFGQSRSVLNQREYWNEVTRQHRPIRVDHAYEGSLYVTDMQACFLRLSAASTQQLLQEVPKAYHTEINDVLLAALAKVMSEWNGRNVVIGLEGHGRQEIAHDIDFSHTVGWFTNLYPVLLDGKGNPAASTLLKETKERLRQVPDKGLGYGILKYINQEASLQGNSPWEITFNYLGQFDTVGRSGTWFSPAGEDVGANVGEEFVQNRKFAVNSYVSGGELLLEWNYSSRHYEAATIQALADSYVQVLESLIAHAVEQAQEQPVFTPSDYGLGGIVSNAELDTFLDATLANGEKRRDQIAGLYRLSALQEGLLFHGLYDEGIGIYIQQFTGDLEAPDLDLLVQSWQYLVDKHSILRSGFHYDAFRIPVQAAYKEVKLPVTRLDYRDLSEEEQQQAWTTYEEDDRNRGFDFAEAPLMRLTLMHLSDTHYRLVWTFHHLLVDGWSGSILIEELLQTYDLLVTGQTLVAPEEDRYEELIRYLERRDPEEDADYWRQYLDGVTSGTLLPFISATAGRTKGKGEYITERMALDGEKARNLLAYAQQNRVTANTVIQGVWAYLLYRYTGNQHVTYGVTVSGRPDDLPGVERRVGMYINTLPFHGVIDPAQGITDWLRQIQSQQVQSREHQYTSLNDMQRWMEISGDLFDNFLVFENYPVSNLLSTHNWHLQLYNTDMQDHANYPLGITAIVAEEISIGFKYNASLLSAAYIEQLCGHFEQVIEQFVSQPAAKVGDISLLTPIEKQRLLVDFNATEVAYPAERTVLDLFQERVTAAPTNTALIFEGETLSYQDLDTRSNQLAHYLTEQGIPAGALVPICLDRSFDMIVGILGILKTGAAYLPIDPSYPAERLTYLLEDSQAQWLITTSTVEIAGSDTLQRIELDTQQEAIHTFSEAALPIQVNPSDLVYVIYTSGSTGKPKGVMLEHKGLVNLVLSQAEALRLRPRLRTLQFASFGFDASCYEIFNTLASGGCLVLPHKDDLLSADRFEALLNSQKIELITLPPSFQHTMREELLNLKTIVSAGEALNREDALYFQSYDIRVINAYGPTENTVCTTLTDDPIQADRVVIGKPIANVQVYFLDAQGQLCPLGVAGEMVVGGNSLARGYWNREELTAEKFIPNPFSTDPAARLYRTGDLGRWLPDGNIEYMGRIDDQVKIRGYRIELGEIEHALQLCAIVNQAVVLTRGEGEAKHLVAFIIPEDDFDQDAISDYLKSKLPEYMVPSVWVEMQSFPLTSNGKINKKALSDPNVGALVRKPYVAPRNEMEQALVDIWQRLLEMDKIGMNDDFFELGGHSLLSIRLTSAIRNELGIELSLTDVFEYPTIASLAEILQVRKEEQESNQGLYDLSKQEWAGDKHILVLNKGPREFPLFLLPGQDGMSEGYDAIGKALNDTAAVYGLQMQGVFADETPLYSMQEIAAQNIEWIKQIQPEGPYRFVGHSFGAYVAYEMAKQLEAAGEKVDLVAVLDAAAHFDPIVLNLNMVDVLYDAAVEVLEQVEIISQPHPEWIIALKEAVKQREVKEVIPFIIDAIQAHVTGEKKEFVEFILRLTNVKAIGVEVLNLYSVTGEINAELVVVKAAQNRWNEQDIHLGWSTHAGTLAETTIAGDHHSMLKNENANSLSQYLKTVLNYSNK